MCISKRRCIPYLELGFSNSSFQMVIYEFLNDFYQSIYVLQIIYKGLNTVHKCGGMSNHFFVFSQVFWFDTSKCAEERL